MVTSLLMMLSVLVLGKILPALESTQLTAKETTEARQIEDVL